MDVAYKSKKAQLLQTALFYFLGHSWLLFLRRRPHIPTLKHFAATQNSLPPWKRERKLWRLSLRPEWVTERLGGARPWMCMKKKKQPKGTCWGYIFENAGFSGRQKRIWKPRKLLAGMAERKRFELLVPFRAHTISNRAPSASSDTSPQERLNYQNEKILARLKFHFLDFEILFPASLQKYSVYFFRRAPQVPENKRFFSRLERF